MNRPPFLSKGDSIAIVGPAGKIDQSVVLKAASVLREWGLQVQLAHHLFDDFFGFSASDEDRKNDLQEALDDPTIKAIMCARGGYGTNRIIDFLNFENFSKNPKWLIGFSDITVLHNHIHNNFGIETIHGTMCNDFVSENTSSETIESLRKVLFGEKTTYHVEPHSLSKRGIAKGILTGGNLAILISLLGTASDVQTSGKILFIEEVGEYHYRIDRMMIQLKRAGKLKNLAGLIVGEFNDMPDKAENFGKSAYEIIADVVSEFNYPVLFGFPAGHGKDNRSLIFGREITFEIKETAVVTF